MIGLYVLPVVLVSCVEKEGTPNIIPLGWVGGVCSDPPQIGISIRPGRFSHELIRETKEFVAYELYDHQTDPTENLNMAGQPEYAAIVAALEAQRKAGWRAAMPDDLFKQER